MSAVEKLERPRGVWRFWKAAKSVAPHDLG